MPNSNATQCNTSLHMPSQRTMKNDKNKIPYRDMRTYQIHISGCIRNPHKPFLFQEKTTKSNKTLAPKMPLNNICIRQIFHTPPDRPSFQCAKMPYQLPLYIFCSAVFIWDSPISRHHTCGSWTIRGKFGTQGHMRMFPGVVSVFLCLLSTSTQQILARTVIFPILASYQRLLSRKRKLGRLEHRHSCNRAGIFAEICGRTGKS